MNPCPPLKLSVTEFPDEALANEDLRLQYRYLDLRRRSIQRMIGLRHQMNKVIRDFMDSHGFLEIETPLLGKSTPEGARDYLVPSRVFNGQFYALPQSPQLYKQLLMIAGYDRYFQIARCLRDEDLRADRQPEFTQVDIEASFVEEEDIFALVDGMFKRVLADCYGRDLPTPVKRFRYDDVLELTTTVSFEGRARLRAQMSIVKQDGGAPVARGYTIHAFTSQTGKPVRPPEWFLEVFGGQAPG